ncbi:uncharacterized protein NECHADRAFT_83166 [Fusarium vanettenii 77-13-4]|uniref:Uncharacterized protein n=1 Tax=Fusarium vanettenii (strain ATCC MYA-4622 / CBS 123669 / FGSC 9596 / NRRL 45880 / 77-13-4) TaxID=660122 RepID=C7ZBF9_FUSV7|nr:uncharacterized protein NECHADRAFT_83166 [Fusarium vanettenii 77-13-4]EEU38848.1 predicted protein [Fusarium vanettenii 77-13-4]
MSTPEHKHWLAPYEVRHGVYAVIGAEVQLHRHEILHHVRGHLEQRHREELYCQLRAGFLMKSFSQLDRLQALDFRNKTVPVYLLTGDAEKRGLSGLLLMVIHNYLYRKWFRLYRSDIERGQAMAIVIPGQSYYTCGLVSRVATMSILIILTGEQEGLSAPISFDSIADRAETVTIGGTKGVRTNLKTAIDFIMFLEEREEAALGPQPDLIASTDASALDEWEGEWIYERAQTMANQLGWDNEPLVGPSSRWVDTAKYPDWTGHGAQMEPSSPNAWNKMGGGSMHMIAAAVITRVL